MGKRKRQPYRPVRTYRLHEADGQRTHRGHIRCPLLPCHRMLDDVQKPYPGNQCRSALRPQKLEHQHDSRIPRSERGIRLSTPANGCQSRLLQAAGTMFHASVRQMPADTGRPCVLLCQHRRQTANAVCQHECSLHPPDSAQTPIRYSQLYRFRCPVASRLRLEAIPLWPFCRSGRRHGPMLSQRAPDIISQFNRNYFLITIH